MRRVHLHYICTSELTIKTPTQSFDGKSNNLNASLTKRKKKENKTVELHSIYIY